MVRSHPRLTVGRCVGSVVPGPVGQSDLLSYRASSVSVAPWLGVIDDDEKPSAVDGFSNSARSFSAPFPIWFRDDFKIASDFKGKPSVLR